MRNPIEDFLRTHGKLMFTKEEKLRAIGFPHGSSFRFSGPPEEQGLAILTKEYITWATEPETFGGPKIINWSHTGGLGEDLARNCRDKGVVAIGYGFGSAERRAQTRHKQFWVQGPGTIYTFDHIEELLSALRMNKEEWTWRG